MWLTYKAVKASLLVCHTKYKVMGWVFLISFQATKTGILLFLEQIIFTLEKLNFYFLSDDILSKINSSKRLTERWVFLFDGLMILCKPNSRRQSSVHHQNHPECRLKEKFPIRMVEIIDHQDTEEMKHAFEIAPRQMQPSVILCAKSAEEKNSWMADLVMLNNR